MVQRITLYKGFYRQLPVILIKWSILGSRVVYVLDHSMASQMESASVSSLPVRNSSSKKSEDLLKNKEQAKTLSRTQVYVSFVHMTLCWGKEVHVPVENGNAAVTESLKAMQDWIKGAKLATNGTARNVIDKEMFSPVSYINHSNAMGANAKLALEDVQAIVEQQDKAWLSFMDNVYILGEHVSVNNDISHIPNWDAVVCLHSTSVLSSHLLVGRGIPGDTARETLYSSNSRGSR